MSAWLREKIKPAAGWGKEGRRAVFLSVCIVLMLHMLFMLQTGKGPFELNSYNSYARQAEAWLQGRLDLGENISWLELAEYGGKFYVSFPVFPSYVLLPFVLVFGQTTPDTLLALAVVVLGVVYAGKLARKAGLKEEQCIWFPVFLYCGTNVWMVTVDGWVWFLAQNLSLALTLMSLYYGLEGKKGRSLFLLCAAVGCRPFQLVWLPLVLCFLYKNGTGGEEPPARRIKALLLHRWYCYLPAALLAASYLLLNLLRFGNPFEFGHHYLPEFQEAEYGQFNLYYLGQNLPSLFRLPTLNAAGRLEFPRFDGCNLLVVFPILIWYFVGLGRRVFRAFQKREASLSRLLWLDIPVLLLFVLHTVFLLLHKTMGGMHFGNRYFVDVLPGIYTALVFGEALLQRDDGADGGKGWSQLQRTVVLLLFLMGLLINFTGVAEVYRTMGQY